MVTDPAGLRGRGQSKQGAERLDARLGADGAALFVAGEHDRSDTSKTAVVYRERLPDVEAHIFEGVGHRVPFEAPERVNPLLLDFLSRVGAS